MKRSTLSALLLLGAMLRPGTAQADVLEVPAEYATIQEAIDAGRDGDEIVVAPGLYFENIRFWGKALHLRSRDGASATIIDGGGSGSVVSLIDDEGPESVIEGFNIRNGDAVDGGGIECFNCETVVRHNIIVENVADYGGGIAVWGGFQDPGPTILGNRIEGNHASFDAGISCMFLGAIVADNVVQNNVADLGHNLGGGVFVSASPFIILRNNLVANNTAAADTPGGVGGGVYFELVDPPEFIGNSVVDNEAYSAGGGVVWADAGDLSIQDSIIWGNSAAMGDQVYGPSGPVLVTYSNVQGGWPGTGNFSEDPLFVAGPLSNYYLSQVAAGQGVDSPCVDTGNPASPPVGGSTRTDHGVDESPVDLGFHVPLGNPFIRGDCNADAAYDLADAITALSYLFGGGMQLECPSSCDSNDDGTLDVSDPIYTLAQLEQFGEAR